jgi:lipopolysaccharide/colanic/teichoic acid biosynthesis glycosyltransferase
MSTPLKNFSRPANDFFAPYKVAYIGSGCNDDIIAELYACYDIHTFYAFKELEDHLLDSTFLELPDLIIVEIDITEECFLFIERIKKMPSLQGLIIILLAQENRLEWRERAIALKTDDIYIYPFDIDSLNERIRFLIKFRIIGPFCHDLEHSKYQSDLTYRIPVSKRLFDVFFSALALFLLSPLLVIIALLIRMESEGPVIYRSKRVGTGYKVFDFYKFRSMSDRADKQLEELSQFNQYHAGDVSAAAFVKIANDPRITKVGKILRNTSLDELPQLFNILSGDMSFVGNRPLPLYEAEQLTSNEWSMRFIGPAGLTGLWQISKRGKKDMSELERKQLDNFYASKHSFWLDFKIILKTFPALIQKEQV